MSGNKRRALTVVLALALVAALAGRLVRRAQPPAVRSPASATPYTHPIVPSPPVVNPAPPNCRVRDLHAATAALRQLRDIAAAAAGGARRPPVKTCHLEPAALAMQARLDVVGQAVTGCVARDAELDSQWNLVQSALTPLQTCADCSADRAARQKGCARVSELLDEADRQTERQ